MGIGFCYAATMLNTIWFGLRIGLWITIGHPNQKFNVNAMDDAVSSSSWWCIFNLLGLGSTCSIAVDWWCNGRQDCVVVLCFVVFLEETMLSSLWYFQWSCWVLFSSMIAYVEGARLFVIDQNRRMLCIVVGWANDASCFTTSSPQQFCSLVFNVFPIVIYDIFL